MHLHLERRHRVSQTDQLDLRPRQGVEIGAALGKEKLLIRNGGSAHRKLLAECRELFREFLPLSFECEQGQGLPADEKREAGLGFGQVELGTGPVRTVKKRREGELKCEPVGILRDDQGSAGILERQIPDPEAPAERNPGDEPVPEARRFDERAGLCNLTSAA